MNSSSAGSRLRAPISTTSSASTAPESISRQGGRPLIPGRRGRHRVEVAVCVEPDDCDSILPGSETLDGTDVRAAAATEDERLFRKIGREREILLLERLRLDHRRLGIRELEPCCFRHRLATLAPGLRNAHETCAEATAARVAFVLRTECDRRVGLAVRALRTKPAHASALSNAIASYATCMPARSYRRVAPVGFSASTPSPTRGWPRR